MKTTLLYECKLHYYITYQIAWMICHRVVFYPQKGILWLKSESFKSDSANYEGRWMREPKSHQRLPSMEFKTSIMAGCTCYPFSPRQILVRIKTIIFLDSIHISLKYHDRHRHLQWFDWIRFFFLGVNYNVCTYNLSCIGFLFY